MCVYIYTSYITNSNKKMISIVQERAFCQKHKKRVIVYFKSCDSFGHISPHCHLLPVNMVLGGLLKHIQNIQHNEVKNIKTETSIICK